MNSPFSLPLIEHLCMCLSFHSCSVHESCVWWTLQASPETHLLFLVTRHYIRRFVLSGAFEVLLSSFFTFRSQI